MCGPGCEDEAQRELNPTASVEAVGPGAQVVPDLSDGGEMLILRLLRITPGVTWLGQCVTLSPNLTDLRLRRCQSRCPFLGRGDRAWLWDFTLSLPAGRLLAVPLRLSWSNVARSQLDLISSGRLS